MEKDTHQVPPAAPPQSSQLKYEDRSPLSPSFISYLCLYRKIFVGGISSETNEVTLKSYFSQWGEVEDAKIMIDADTKRSRGFGFVTYKEPACVHIACQGSHVLDGKKVCVEMNTSRAFVISRLDDKTNHFDFFCACLQLQNISFHLLFFCENAK